MKDAMFPLSKGLESSNNDNATKTAFYKDRSWRGWQ
jgi:hypothetical protein